MSTERTFKNRDMISGEIVEKTYQPKGPTLNDILTDDLEGTIEYWLEEKFEKVDPESFKYVKKGSYVKYITSSNKVRVGGILMVKEKEYFVLKNMKNSMSWSIQLKNTKNMYVRKDITPVKFEKEALVKLKQNNKKDIMALMEQEYAKESNQDLISSQINFYKHMKRVPGGDLTTVQLARTFIKSKKTEGGILNKDPLPNK